MDDVLVNMRASLQVVLDDYSGTTVPYENWHTYCVNNYYPSVTDDVFNNLVIKSDIFRTADPISGTIEGMNMLSEQGYNLHIVSARGFHPDAHNITKQWLLDNGVPFDTISISHYGEPKSHTYAKLNYKFAFMLDDHVSNIQDAAESTLVSHPILISAPWNLSRSEYVTGHNRFDCVGKFAQHVLR